MHGLGVVVPLDVVDDFDRGLGDVVHILAVGVFTEEAGRANDDVYPVHTGRHGELCVLQRTPDICHIVLTNWREGLEGENWRSGRY